TDPDACTVNRSSIVTTMALVRSTSQRGGASMYSFSRTLGPIPEALVLVTPDYARRHLRIGWWSLLCFATVGLVLEMLHGFKVRAYLDVSNETRRLMWTLGHAHGTLLALLHVIFGLSLRTTAESFVRNLRLISSCLIGASVLLPGGF